jgi:uncharacterized protein YvpB
MPESIPDNKPPSLGNQPFPSGRRLLVRLLAGIALLFLGALFLDGQEIPAIPPVPSLVVLPGTPQPTTKFPATWTPSPAPMVKASIHPIITNSPTPTPTLPVFVQVHGIVPRDQALPLDCESNVATLFAGFLGYKIDELKFQAALPKSDNPNRGFVGDVKGVWGSTPPEAYGAHASPVAITLRSFYVPALDVYQYSLINLKRQLASGYPVMVWVVGHVEKGKAIPWHSSDGYITYVAPFEHTVLVMGYDEAGVTILDNLEIYGRSYKEFMDSWSVLGYMAIIKYP